MKKQSFLEQSNSTRNNANINIFLDKKYKITPGQILSKHSSSVNQSFKSPFSRLPNLGKQEFPLPSNPRANLQVLTENNPNSASLTNLQQIDQKSILTSLPSVSHLKSTQENSDISTVKPSKLIHTTENLQKDNSQFFNGKQSTKSLTDGAYISNQPLLKRKSVSLPKLNQEPLQEIDTKSSDGINIYDEKSGIFKRTRITDAYNKFRVQSKNLHVNLELRKKFAQRLSRYNSEERPIDTDEYFIRPHAYTIKAPDAIEFEKSRNYQQQSEGVYNYISMQTPKRTIIVNEPQVNKKSQELRDYFRKKHYRMPQNLAMPVSEDLPLVALQKSLSFNFQKSHLDAEGQEQYKKIEEMKLIGQRSDPFEFVNLMFSKFNSSDLKSINGQSNRYHQLMMFTQKLTGINQEIDAVIASQIAEFIVQQYDIVQQKRKLLKLIEPYDQIGMVEELRKDIAWKDHRLFIDQVNFLGQGARERLTNMAQMTGKMLAKMKVLPEDMFIDVSLYQQSQGLLKHVDRHIESFWEPIFVAGLGFFLDHLDQKVVPFVSGDLEQLKEKEQRIQRNRNKIGVITQKKLIRQLSYRSGLSPGSKLSVLSDISSKKENQRLIRLGSIDS